MSHTVTVTRTTTTTTSAIIINTGYLKTWPGILKILELILGIMAVGLTAYHYNRYGVYTVITLFLLIATTFMIGTFIILLSCLISISTASIVSKTIYEPTYHGIAFFLYLIASLWLLVEVNSKKNSYYHYDYETYFPAAIVGLILTALYFLSTVFAYRSYKGL